MTYKPNTDAPETSLGGGSGSLVTEKYARHAPRVACAGTSLPASAQRMHALLHGLTAAATRCTPGPLQTVRISRLATRHISPHFLIIFALARLLVAPLIPALPARGTPERITVSACTLSTPPSTRWPCRSTLIYI